MTNRLLNRDSDRTRLIRMDLDPVNKDPDPVDKDLDTVNTDPDTVDTDPDTVDTDPDPPLHKYNIIVDKFCKN